MQPLTPPKATMLDAWSNIFSPQRAAGSCCFLLICDLRGRMVGVIHVISNYRFYSLSPLDSGKTEICLFDTVLQSQNIVCMSSLLSFFPQETESWDSLLHCSISAGGEGMENRCHTFLYGLQRSWFHTHLGCRSLLTDFWISPKGNWSMCC